MDMNDNPIVTSTDDPLFIKRESWLKKQLQKALEQPYVSFQEAAANPSMGIYFIYDDLELLYIGMATRPSKNRLKEFLRGYRSHTFNRKLMAEEFRNRDYLMHTLSVKNLGRDWIDNGKITTDEFDQVQEVVNQRRKSMRYKYFEYSSFGIQFLEHYAIATMQPLYND